MQTRRLELFTTIHTEGAILPVDILQRILDGDSAIEGTSPDSYHLGAGEKINEAVNRSWNRLQGLWLSFQNAKEKLPATDTGTSLTRDKWLLQLFQELGYGRLQTGKAIEHDNKLYAISHQWKHTLIHLVSFKLDLDKRQKGVTGASKSSPHSLVQELLNASDEHLWGFVSNGLRLRILRDNRSLTRQSYVEFDVEGMMNGEVYSDFVLLWMLCHQSRVEADKPEECWLEKWSQTAQVQGVRALDELRKGVEQAIKELGQGFLSHAGNAVLRETLKSGMLPTQEYYRQLFRLVYRLLFLFVAEDRDLLLHPKADTSSRERYNRHYSLTRLRRMASKLRGSKHVDAWEQVRLVMDILSGDSGYDALGLPALGGYLFSDEAIPDLNDCDITNHDFLTAVRALAFIVDKGTLRPVDYKNLRSEEFGSVYESLLELHPVINADAGTFELKTAGGNERKTTASYYTHDSLVQCLLDSALDPVVDEACKKTDPEKAILGLKICDFASGSGHFLTAAAHRMAKRLAGIRTEEQEPAPEAIRTALRDVIGHCIYGVDINPMAVELCKVALWMEALEAGKPLSFLDHHIQCGNSLIGATPALLKKGIPDEAFTAIEGDDKEVCKRYKKRNKEERGGQTSFYGKLAAEPRAQYAVALDQMYESIDNIDDQSIDGIHQKEQVFKRLLDSPEYREQRGIADAWCSAFVWMKTKEGAPAVTDHVFRTMVENYTSTPQNVKEEIERLAYQYRFFHWHLAFPDVFRAQVNSDEEETGWSGGFDVVLGNPPWERIKIQEKEWFAIRNPEIADATNAAIRKRLIDNLKSESPAVYEAFRSALRQANGESQFMRNSGRYPLCGRGDINLYSVFAESMRMLLSPKGRIGCVLPSGLSTDDTTKHFFHDLLEKNALVSFYEFENEGFFEDAGQGHMLRFALTTMVGTQTASREADFVFQATQISELNDHERHFTLTENEIGLLNPNTHTCPIFRTKRDAEINKQIYRNHPILMFENGGGSNPWNISFMRMFDMANDSYLFRRTGDLEADGWKLAGNVFVRGQERMLPLYEAKMVNQYNHRHGDFSLVPNNERAHILPEVPTPMLKDCNHFAMPYYWVDEKEVGKKLLGKQKRKWLLGWRDVTDARASARTVISSVIPTTAVNDAFLLIIGEGNEHVFLYSILVSFVFDYAARQKIGGLHLKYHVFKQLPILLPETYKHLCSWVGGDEMLASWIQPRALELTYTAWDLQPFAQDCGYNGAPFKWNEGRRFLLRSELDAAYFHLYGIERDDVDYIMETFPIVKRKDESKYGEYRTKRMILEIYDEMKVAMESGVGYKTRLDPPPADERVAHKEGVR
jgi:hypothetical protein